MPYQTLMPIIDTFIDTSINRFSSENGPTISRFFLDMNTLFPDRQRITQHLIKSCIDLFNSRGIVVEPVAGPALNVIVNLNTCLFNPQQAEHYSTALQYVRTVHGNYN